MIRLREDLFVLMQITRKLARLETASWEKNYNSKAANQRLAKKCYIILRRQIKGIKRL